MNPRLFISYIGWHYSKAYNDFFSIWSNFFRFFYNFFSIKILIKTLFSPFKRMHEERKASFDFQDLFEVIVVNTIMRIVGFIIKAIFIIFWFFVELLVFVIGFLSLIAWTAIPFILIALVVVGITFII